MQNIIAKKACNRQKDAMQRFTQRIETSRKNPDEAGVKAENKRVRYYEKPDEVRIREMLGNFTTEELLMYLQENHGGSPAHTEVVENSKYRTDLFSLLKKHEHAVIPYQSGEGATHSGMVFEMYERLVSGGNLVIPLDLSLLKSGSIDQMICQSMGRLVELIERFHLIYDRKSMSGAHSQFVVDYARVVKTGGKPMQNLLRAVVNHRRKDDDPEGLEALFPIAQRIQSRYVGSQAKETFLQGILMTLRSLVSRKEGAIPSLRDRKQFIRNVDRTVKRAKAIQTVPEMVKVVHNLLGDYAQNIYLVADIQNNREAKRTLDALTDHKLIARLQEVGVYLKVFSPARVKTKNTGIKVLDGVFAWNDELIVQMINEKMRSCNTWMRLETFQSEKMNLVPRILEYAQRNPRRAMEVTHALLEEVGKANDGWLMDAQTWNGMCDNWKVSSDRPKKIKL
ncbi:MAG: hypothetical protein BroJett025_06430 [Patescibacteria group bacterium]|nr:MAG: hypothetical protein BroJett025_06430 [Patescibacteria group bacterium]